ncbi:RING-H2 finger protein ATL3F [Carex littledalei]|uniref:RING-H2 finger protein ATL3F n=1 Tax=Carex littledalei TaxID=544730 RepID=A0A833QNL0_9POAL|nr:RING-H2 finger protein ATL3F [Carex littledalei]
MSSLIAPTPSENISNEASHPHPLTITCVVIANVLIILIIYFVFFFWKCNRGSAWDEAFDNSASANSSPCSSPRASGVKAKDLSFLPEFVHGGTEGEKEECAVCITEFVNGQIGRVLPVCGHKFHIECLDTWFQKHSTCPICRTDVQEKIVEEKGEKMCLDV